MQYTNPVEPKHMQSLMYIILNTNYLLFNITLDSNTEHEKASTSIVQCF